MRPGLNALLTVVAFSCSQQTGTADEAVRQVMEGIIKADNESDIGRVLSFYDEDAVLVPPVGPVIAGASAIRSNYERIFNGSKLELAIQIDSLLISADTAAGYGLTVGRVTTLADGSVRQINDRYVMRLKRKDGMWKITRLMWNPQ